jgi:hypothetical protein
MLAPARKGRRGRYFTLRRVPVSELKSKDDRPEGAPGAPRKVPVWCRSDVQNSMCRQTLGDHVAHQATANLSSLYLALLMGRLGLRLLATNSSIVSTYTNLRERAPACATVGSVAIVIRSGHVALMRHVLPPCSPAPFPCRGEDGTGGDRDQHFVGQRADRTDAWNAHEAFSTARLGVRSR